MQPKTAVCRIFFFPLQTANVACFRKKNPIIRNFCISGRLVVPINPEKYSYTVLQILNPSVLGSSWNLNPSVVPRLDGKASCLEPANPSLTERCSNRHRRGPANRQLQGR